MLNCQHNKCFINQETRMRGIVSGRGILLNPEHSRCHNWLVGSRDGGDDYITKEEQPPGLGEMKSTTLTWPGIWINSLQVQIGLKPNLLVNRVFKWCSIKKINWGLSGPNYEYPNCLSPYLRLVPYVPKAHLLNGTSPKTPQGVPNVPHHTLHALSMPFTTSMV